MLFRESKGKKALKKVAKLEEKAKIAIEEDEKNLYYQKAFDILWDNRKLAYPPLDCTIGKYYSLGRFVAKDCEKAKTWFERAASFNYAPAMYELFSFHRHEDTGDALSWILKAEERGYYLSKEDYDFIGRCFEEGDGCDMDIYSAIKYYEKARDLGSNFARNQLLQWRVVGDAIYLNY